MSVRIFTLKFNSLIGGFDDGEVRAFIADKEVDTIHDHAFVYQGLPYITLVVTYHGQSSEESFVPTETKKRTYTPSEDWRKLVTESDIPLFNSFREWRTVKAKEEGVPSYFICTNKQLADIVQKRPNSMTDLAHVDGFGEGRMKKYGSDILAILTKKLSGSNPENTVSSSSAKPSEETLLTVIEPVIEPSVKPQ